MAGACNQLNLITQFIRMVTKHYIQLGVINPLDNIDILSPIILARLVQMHSVVKYVINPPEALSHTYRPGNRCALDLENLFHLIQQLDGVAAFTIKLVDECGYRRVTQPAYIHKLDGTLLNTLGTVDYHERGINCSQRPVGVFRKVFMARGIEQVHDCIIVRKLHDRRCHRNTALFFQLHPVGGCMTCGLATLHRACQLNSTTKQQ